MDKQVNYTIDLNPRTAEDWAKSHTEFKPEKLSYEEFRNFCINYSCLLRKMRDYLGMIREALRQGGYNPAVMEYWPTSFAEDVRKSLSDFELNKAYAERNYPELVPLFSDNEVTLYRLLFNKYTELSAMTWFFEEDEDKLIDNYLNYES